MDVMERQKLTEDQIEKLAVEIREFLLEHGMWQDVDIYFNHKRFGCKDPETGRYFYNDREHLFVEEDIEPQTYFEYVNPDHILSMSFEGPVCEMLYYCEYPAIRKSLMRFLSDTVCIMSSEIIGISAVITFEEALYEKDSCRQTHQRHYYQSVRVSAG